MLTKEDKKFLAKNFATKSDLKSFATKNDLKSFATKNDLKSFATKSDLKSFATKNDLKSFATKSDLAEVHKDIADLKTDSSLIQQTVIRLEDSFSRSESKIDKILTILDGFSGKVSDLQQENKMGAITLHRHGIQIEELAVATGTKISK